MHGWHTPLFLGLLPNVGQVAAFAEIRTLQPGATSSHAVGDVRTSVFEWKRPSPGDGPHVAACGGVHTGGLLNVRGEHRGLRVRSTPASDGLSGRGRPGLWCDPR